MNGPTSDFADSLEHVIIVKLAKIVEKVISACTKNLIRGRQIEQGDVE